MTHIGLISVSLIILLGVSTIHAPSSYMPKQNRALTVNHIFAHNHNWELFLLTHPTRKAEREEVQKMLTCQDESRGYKVYQCPECWEQKIIHFGCNSRICSYCNKHYTDKWADKLARRLLNVPHRHVVMTIPDKLRPLFMRPCKNRMVPHWGRMKGLMDCSIKVISHTIKWSRNKEIKPGIVAIIHTFGRDMKFNPHIHCLVTEGGFRKNGEWVPIGYIPYETLRKAWQYEVLTELKRWAIVKFSKKNRELIDSLFKEYPKGFYVYAKDRIKGRKQIAGYIGRYIRHPAIANSRIDSYDGRYVTFWYEDHTTNEKKYRTMEVKDFISVIIGHIPDRNFKTIRYYGVYERTRKKFYRGLLNRYKSMRPANLSSGREKRGVICPKCGTMMELVYYQPSIPPPNLLNYGERLTDWPEILARTIEVRR